MGLLLCISACKKAEHFNSHIHGQVLDADTRQPVAGMPVTLEYIGGSSGFGPNLNTHDYPATITDKNGRYAFDFDSRSDGSHNDRYRMSGNGPETYFGFGAEIPADSANGRTLQLDFSCYQRIAVAVKLIHDGPANPDDLISLDIIPYPYGYGISELQYGNEPEVIVRAEVVPNHLTLLHYFTKHNGVYPGQMADSFVFTQAGQEYSIHY